MSDQLKPTVKAWIVTSPVEPPSDWGFKPDWWHKQYYRVVTAKLHATQIFLDLNRLEIPKIKAKPFHATHF